MKREREWINPFGDVTGLIEEWAQGDEEALRELIPRVYGELRNLAERLGRRKRFSKISRPTVLVNELYMRLANKAHNTTRLHFPDRLHFYAFAGTLMRRILVDEARRQTSQRAGGQVSHLTLDESLDSPTLPAVDPITLLSLHQALDKLADLDPRQAQIVEYKYFAGLTVMEIARLMNLSRATVNRELQTARVLLAGEMGRKSSSSSFEEIC